MQRVYGVVHVIEWWGRYLFHISFALALKYFPFSSPEAALLASVDGGRECRLRCAECLVSRVLIF